MIKKGTLCVWQNVDGPGAYLNGSDVIALSGLHMMGAADSRTGRIIKGKVLGYETDQDWIVPGRWIKVKLGALAHQLREKNPPPDELVDEDEAPTNKNKELENV